MSNGQPFRMTVDLNVLDHLADGLYSSVAAVITETVANAWDADATEISIALALDDDRIAVSDNGVGMDTAAVNNQYLRVGYRRRAHEDRTPRGRAVMGRKGIGKLSLFSIADVIEVHTKVVDAEPVGFRIVAHDLRSAMASGLAEYNPTPVAAEIVPGDRGTRIVVTHLKRERLREVSPDSLRRRLARRFSVIGSDDFYVSVNGSRVTAADRDDLRFVEYLWVFGDREIDLSERQPLPRARASDLEMQSEAS